MIAADLRRPSHRPHSPTKTRSKFAFLWPRSGFTPWMHALLTLSIPERESTSMYVSVLKRSHRAGKLLATLELYAEYGDNKAQQHHSHGNNSLSLAYSTWSIRWPCFVLFRNGTSSPRGPLGAHGSRGGTQCIRQGVLQSSGPTHPLRRKALLEGSWSSPGETMPSRCSERRRKAWRPTAN